MVTIKRLTPEFPRLGYEVQKGLMIDLDGTGDAEITESDDGTLTLRSGKQSVSLKDVRVMGFGKPNIVINMSGGLNENHLVLDDVMFDTQSTMIACFGSDNVINGTHFVGPNNVAMMGHRLIESTIIDGRLDRASVKDSFVEHSYLLNSIVDDSNVLNSDLDSTTVTKNSRIELSHLMSDTVNGAIVGGVDAAIDWPTLTVHDRTFSDGYFVGQKGDGYGQVTDEKVYKDGLAQLIVNRDLPYTPQKEGYVLDDDMKERLEKAWGSVPDAYKNETLESAPFLKDVVEPPALTDAEIAQSVAEDTAWREADDFVIDESQFEVNVQKGLQQ